MCDHGALRTRRTDTEATGTDLEATRTDTTTTSVARPSVGNVSVHAVLLISPGTSMFFFAKKIGPLVSLYHAKQERKDASASFRPSLLRSFLHPRVIRSNSAPTQDTHSHQHVSRSRHQHAHLHATATQHHLTLPPSRTTPEISCSVCVAAQTRSASYTL